MISCSVHIQPFDYISTSKWYSKMWGLPGNFTGETLTGTVSIFGCWKIRLQINYILEKINIPQTWRRRTVWFWSMSGIFKVSTDRRNTVEGPSERSLQRGSVTEHSLVRGRARVHPGSVFSASSAILSRVRDDPWVFRASYPNGEHCFH